MRRAAVAIALLALGIYSLSSSIRSYAVAQSCKAWPSVTGAMSSSGFKTTLRGFGRYNFETAYKVYVEYDYEVNGVRYTSERYYPDSDPVTFAELIDARSHVEELKPGAQVDVFYKPQSPGESVLDKTLRRHVVPRITVGFILTLCGGAGMAMFVHAARKNRRREI